ncbi:Protein of unknown function [Cotesia congregata]|uniref:Uncharacterized protein n=1 Tax=Cotesia congregata TaxID=51543 RepID=A0A8J2HLD9_COTCN|nr:Protein of unknown function [Cotesia congregata]
MVLSNRRMCEGEKLAVERANAPASKSFKRRYWEIGLAAPSLEFKANDGPSKEGRDEECDMCLFFPASTFSTCRVRM